MFSKKHMVSDEGENSIAFFGFILSNTIDRSLQKLRAAKVQSAFDIKMIGSNIF